MSGKKGMKKYPAEMKLEAMRLFYEEGKPRAEIADLLEVHDPHRVKAWLKQYRREGVEGFNQPQGRPRKRRESEAEELQRLRMENALLKKTPHRIANGKARETQYRVIYHHRGE